MRPEPTTTGEMPQASLRTVTFAFTDIEGSTMRWECFPQAMQAALRLHDAILHAAIADHGGRVFKTIGDAFRSVFDRAADAAAAMLAVQHTLAAQDFSAVDGLRVRAAIHSETTDDPGPDPLGLAVVRAAQLLAIGHGGQVLVSATTCALIQDALPPHVTLRDLGMHSLKDLSRPEHVFGLLGPGLAAEFPPLRSLSALPNNLPLARTSFVGRENEVEDIAQLIETHRLVTIVGSGGVGKTRACVHVAANLVEQFADGAWFIELAPLASGEYLPATVAQAMGLTLRGDAAPLQLLSSELKLKRALLIFDNCEHLVEPAAQTIAVLLRGCPDLRILVSTRQSLGISGEMSYRMPSLRIPQAGTPLTTAEAAGVPAVALFVERAAAVDHRFVLTDDNAPAVVEICRRLDGIPLAIELAAARISILTPRQLHGRLDERFRLLAGGSRDVLPRQQTLRALIDWSYDLLDARERTLFRRLAVFVNGFTLDGAIAVGSGPDLDELDAFDVLASLADKSLVLTEPDRDELRYRMLESTRAYAREKLTAVGELSASLGRHRRYLRDGFAAALVRAEHSGSPAELDALLAAELEDVRAALEGTGAEHEAAQLLAAIGFRWGWIGLGTEGAARLERAVVQLAPGEAGLLSRLLTAVAMINATSNTIRAREAASQAVGLARSAADPAALACALTAHAETLTRGRLFDAARSALAEAEALTPAENRLLHVLVLDTRAFLGYFTGDLDAAADAYEQLRETYRQLGNVSSANGVAISLAEVEHQRGRTDDAIALAQETLPALRVARDRLADVRAFAEEAFTASAGDDRNGLFVTCVLEHAALAIALSGDARRGAQLAGYTDAALRRAGCSREYTERTTRTRLDALLRERLTADDGAALLASGAALTSGAAITLARGA